MATDDRYARLDELVASYNDVLDEIQQVRATAGGTRPELEDKANALNESRAAEIQRLISTGTAPEAIDAHLDATDRYRQGR